MSLQQVLTYITDSQNLLPGWLQKAQNLNQLIAIFAQRFQLLENIFWQLFTLRDINNATNSQLDVIGRILNLARQPGQTDISYRVSLKGQVSNLSNSGQPESLIAIYLNIYQQPPGNATSVELIEIKQATVQLTVNINVDPNIDSSVLFAMNTVKAAGINLILQKAINNPFRYKDINSPNLISNGYQNLSNPGTGGNLATLIGQYV